MSLEPAKPDSDIIISSGRVLLVARFSNLTIADAVLTADASSTSSTKMASPDGYLWPRGEPLHKWFVERRLRRFERRRLLPDAVEDGVRFQLTPAVHAEAAGSHRKPLMPPDHHEFVTHRTPLRRVVRP